jgi:hypothetical protein
MTEILKILHFLALAAAVGGGVANMAGAMQMKSAEGPARAAISALQARVSRISAGALALLWITGIALVYDIYGGWGGFGWAFWAKIAAVVGLTATSATAQVLMARARAAGGPPPAGVIPKLGRAGMVFALASVVFATLAFTY